jgi:putative ABC transport system permease protein
MAILDELRRDVRHGSRMLAQRPGFTILAVLTLALGIGASTLIFSVADGVLFRPLPYSAPDRLVAAHQTHAAWLDSPNPVLRGFASAFPVSWPVYEDWRQLSRVFAEVGVYREATVTLTDSERPERLVGARATFGVLAALGTQPLLGRLFLPSDDALGAEKIVILSHGLWSRLFGSESSALGQVIRLDATPYTIVGVMPPAFYFPR